jgi:hypothetical protein
MIVAHGSGKEFATITFNVIPPSGVIQRIETDDAPLIHFKGKPEIGFTAHSYLQPDSVSFQFVLVGELDICATATGPFVAQGHHPGPFIPVGDVVPGLGSRVSYHDTIFSGGYDYKYNAITDPNPPPGELVFVIPWAYQISATSEKRVFTSVTSRAELKPDRKTLVATKAGATATT